MRNIKETKLILKLRKQGKNNCEISRITGIPRTTVRDVRRCSPILAEATDLKSVKCGFESHHRHYAYLLGMYLGDGYICKNRRTYRIRISCATDYPDIINDVKKSLQGVFKNNKVGIVKKKSKCVDVYCYSNFLPNIFPQHGAGQKHERKIILSSWQ